MKKSAQLPINKKRKIRISKKELTIVALLLLAFIIGILAVNIYNKSQESKLVSNMVKVTQQYYNQHSKILGINASADDINKSCVPIDKMWNSKYKYNCSTNVTKSIDSINTKEQAAIAYDSLKQLLPSQGFIISDSTVGFADPTISLKANTSNYPKKDSNDIFCSMAYLYNENANNPYSATGAAYELYCSVDLNNVPEGFNIRQQ